MISIPTNIKGKIDAFSRRTKFYFSELRSYGYEFVGEEFNDALIVKYPYRIMYQNLNLGLDIVIHFQPLDIDLNQIDFLSVDIRKSENKRKVINLSKLVEHQQPEFDSDYLLFVNNKKNGTFEENLNITLQLQLMYLLEVAKKIILGEVWSDEFKYVWSEQLDKVLYEKQQQIIYGKDNKNRK